MKNNRVLTGLVSLTLLLAGGSSHAEVYKWTDEKGQLHFGDQPPAIEFEQVKIRQQSTLSTTSSVSDAQRKEIRQQQLKKLLAGYDARNEAEEEEKEKKQKQKNTRNKSCNDAKSELLTTQSANLIFYKKEDGSKVYISDPQHQQLIDINQADVKKWCS